MTDKRERAINAVAQELYANTAVVVNEVRLKTVAEDIVDVVLPKDTVVIAQEKLAELEADSDFLERLRAAGVDNWEGYGEAFRSDDEDAE